MAKREKLVRYISPFGSPAWMTREQAEKYLAQDTPLYDRLDLAGALSDRERQVGWPRIEVGP